MITAIKIDEENFKHYSLVNEQEEENKGYLDNLSKINIFIGENNSGKSRFMRELFSNENIKYKNNISNNIKWLLINLIYDINKIVSDYQPLDNTFVDDLIYDIKFRTFIDGTNLSISRHSYLNEIADEIIQKLSQNSIYKYSLSHLSSEIKKASAQKQLEIGKYVKEREAVLDIMKTSTYIPMLRGLRTYDNIFTTSTHAETDIYKWRTKRDYFKKHNEEIRKRIFTGLGLYEDCKNLLLGGKKDRDKIRNFEEFISKCFFDGEDFNLIPSITDDVLHVLIGNQERPIYELGDGIQSVIILTYPLFFNQGENMLFFFEEPEQCLHPAYQRVFMETLMRKEFDTFQYFFTTHSNHLLDITLDIDKVSIYTFKKTNDSMDNPTFEIENVDNENTDILRLIGVRNSSVFLSNCTIWVEGITDRIYIKEYLKVFQEDEIRKAKEEKRQITNYLEDIHYSFVEYGGNNITHWSFLEDDDNDDTILVDRLCGKLFLITDQDGAGQLKGTKQDKEKKQLRHETLKARLGDDHYYCLKAREIENMLSTDVLKAVIESYEGKNKATLLFHSTFTYENYKNEKIGDFINANITYKRKGGYAKDSGTIIGDKAEFAKRAVKEIKSIDNLSKEARDLTEELYKFIENQNGDKNSVTKL